MGILRKNSYLFLAAVFTLAGLISPFYIFNTFYSKANYPTSDPLTIEQLGKLGQVSDWISGATVPFFTFASVILLYLAYRTQKQELEEARKQLVAQNESIELQRFENTFFHMLTLYHEIVKSISYNEQTSLTYNPNENYSGRVYFEFAYGRLGFLYKALHSHSDEGSPYKLDYELESMNEVFGTFFRGQQSVIGHYIRHLLSMVKFIASAKMDKTQKQFYFDVLRAQLSTYELVILFYSQIGDYAMVENIRTFKQFSFFYYINKGMLFSEKHWEIYEDKFI